MPIQGQTPDQYRLAHLLDTPLIVSAVRDSHPMFDKIIDKLLSKAPDERYLTAAGLRYDFQRLLELIEKEERDSFDLGTREVPFIFPLPNELIGRAEEFSALDQLYELCLDPEQCGFCSLRGKPGVGKTALVQAFALQHHNPYVFSFKFNQFGNTPMHAIIEVRGKIGILPEKWIHCYTLEYPYCGLTAGTP